MDTVVSLENRLAKHIEIVFVGLNQELALLTVVVDIINVVRGVYGQVVVIEHYFDWPEKVSLRAFDISRSPRCLELNLVARGHSQF